MRNDNVRQMKLAGGPKGPGTFLLNAGKDLATGFGLTSLANSVNQLHGGEDPGWGAYIGGSLGTGLASGVARKYAPRSFNKSVRPALNIMAGQGASTTLIKNRLAASGLSLDPKKNLEMMQSQLGPRVVDELSNRAGKFLTNSVGGIANILGSVGGSVQDNLRQKELSASYGRLKQFLGNGT